MILNGDALTELKQIPAESVHCCVTSPPYYWLRDYGFEDQIGLEKTPEEYVARLVEVFREVRRVLRKDGTLWLNLGDSYAGTGKSGGGSQGGRWEKSGAKVTGPKGGHWSPPPPGLKQKDLIGIPWRAAFALQADGWFLRSDIIWHKPNPMPESVRDRCTKAHEYVFMLTKSAQYFYDAEAVKEPVSESTKRIYSSAGVNSVTGVEAGRKFVPESTPSSKTKLGNGSIRNLSGRNRRDVWTITTKPYKGAHFATMPPDLAEICIKAGCPEGGTVLDPFAGSGTTGAVAKSLGQDYILIEANPDYIELINDRVGSEARALL